MRKLVKRCLSVVLMCALLVSVVPAQVFAAESDNAAAVVHESPASSGSYTPVSGITVDVSGAADNSMDTGIITVTAQGDAENYGTGAVSKTATITVTNSNSVQAEISFFWLASNVYSLKVDGEIQENISDNFSRIMDAGDSVTITITTGNNDTVNSLTLKKFAVKPLQNPSGPSVTAKDISPAVIDGITDQIYTGSAITQNITVTVENQLLVKGTDYLVEYRNNIAVGKATVIITGIGDYAGSVSKEFVIAAKDLSGVSVSGITNKPYTGSAVKQEFTVTDKGRTLTEGTDYTVSYENNIKPGTAVITITGTGNYTGSLEKTFKITTASVTGLTITAIKDQSYTGAAIKPKLTVKHGNTTLKEGTDYTVSYKNNTKIGTAAATITGKGNFTGSKTINFNIVPGKVSGFTVTKSDVTAVTLKWNKEANAAGYLVYRWDAGAGKWIQLTKTTALSYENSGLKSGTEYRYAVKAYKTVNNKNYYSGLTELKTATNPAKVTGFAVSKTTANSVALKWNKVSGATSYLVYKKNGSKWEKIADTTALTHTHKNLKAVTVYEYAVKAYKKVDGKTYNGAYPTLKTTTGPAKVSGLKVSKTTDKAVTLKWNKVSGATGYLVYRMSDGKWVQIAKTTTALTYTNSSLKAGTTYQYAVKAYKSYNSKNYGGTQVELKTSTNPAKVTGFAASKTTSSSVALKWNKVSGATGYLVYKKNGSKWEKIADTTALTYTHKNLKSSTAYEYAVKAYKKLDGKTYNGAYPTLKITTASSKISGLKVSATTNNSITLKWNRMTDAAGYHVYRWDDGTKSWKKLKDTTGLSYTDSSLKKNKSYQYRVRAYMVNNGKTSTGQFAYIVGTTNYSIQNTEGTSSFCGKVPAVTIDRNNLNAAITWTEVAGADGYLIYRKYNRKDGSWTKIANVSAKHRSYTDIYEKSFSAAEKSSLILGYFADPSDHGMLYTVKAYKNENGKKIYSSYYADGDFTLTAPSIISVTKESTTSAKITWGTVDNAESYYLYSGIKNSSGKLTWTKVGTVAAGSAVQQSAVVSVNKNHTHFTVKAVADKNGKMTSSSYDTGFTITNRKYENKNILFLGDSITYGTPYASASAREIFSYPWRINQLTGAYCYNPSIPGATYRYEPYSGTGSRRYRLVTDVAAKIRNGTTPEEALHQNTKKFKDFDVVILAAGTNDYQCNSPIGKLNSGDINDFSGALNTILSYIEEGNKERIKAGKKPVKIVFVDLFYSNRTNVKNEITNRYITPNKLGLTLTDYQNRIDALVKQYKARGLSVYQFETDQIVTANNCAYTTSDNLHMTKFTYGQIGNQLAEYLIKNKIL